MAAIGLVLHQTRPEAPALAAEIVERMEHAGHQVRLGATDAELAGLVSHGVPDDQFAPGLDVVVTLGGDGTMLRTVHLVATEGVPVIGVNLGQLGYLTEVEPSGMWTALTQFLAGEHTIEERMLLAVSVEPAAGSDAEAMSGLLALNDLVLEKTPGGHTVRVDVTIDGEFFTPYAADGVIVATPTGSTAYNFSVRGPIVEPTHRAMLLTPVSPHMLFDRTLVLEPDSELRITVSGHRAAAVLVDGRDVVELHLGDTLVCTAAPFPARLVMFGPRDFHRILKAKFGLSDR